MGKKTNATLVAIGIVVSVLAGATGGALLTQAEPIEVTPEPIVVNATQNQLDLAYQLGQDSVEPLVVNNTVIETVEDTEFLKIVCERALYDDLVDCRSEIMSENAALESGLDKIKSDYAVELALEGIVLDRNRVDLIHVYDKYDEIVVLTSDYDKKRYVFEVEARVFDDRANEQKDVVFTVESDHERVRILNVEE